MLAASARRFTARAVGSSGLLARTLPKRQLGMSVSVYGEYKEKNMMQSTAGWDFQRNEEIPDTPEFANLDAWRAHLKSEGKEDPLAHLNAADRVAYVDSHRMYDAKQKIGIPVFGWEYGPESRFYGRSKVLLNPASYLKNPWLTHAIDNKKWEIYYTKEIILRMIDQPEYLMKNVLPKTVMFLVLLIAHHQYSLYERNFKKELKRKYLEKDKE